MVPTPTDMVSPQSSRQPAPPAEPAIASSSTQKPCGESSTNPTPAARIERLLLAELPRPSVVSPQLRKGTDPEKLDPEAYYLLPELILLVEQLIKRPSGSVRITDNFILDELRSWRLNDVAYRKSFRRSLKQTLRKPWHDRYPRSAAKKKLSRHAMISTGECDKLFSKVRPYSRPELPRIEPESLFPNGAAMLRTPQAILRMEDLQWERKKGRDVLVIRGCSASVLLKDSILLLPTDNPLLGELKAWIPSEPYTPKIRNKCRDISRDHIALGRPFLVIDSNHQIDYERTQDFIVARTLYSTDESLLEIVCSGGTLSELPRNRTPAIYFHGSQSVPPETFLEYFVLAANTAAREEEERYKSNMPSLRRAPDVDFFTTDNHQRLKNLLSDARDTGRDRFLTQYAIDPEQNNVRSHLAILDRTLHAPPIFRSMQRKVYNIPPPFLGDVWPPTEACPPCGSIVGQATSSRHSVSCKEPPELCSSEHTPTSEVNPVDLPMPPPETKAQVTAVQSKGEAKKPVGRLSMLAKIKLMFKKTKSKPDKKATKAPALAPAPPSGEPSTPSPKSTPMAGPSTSSPVKETSKPLPQPPTSTPIQVETVTEPSPLPTPKHVLSVVVPTSEHPKKGSLDSQATASTDTTQKSSRSASEQVDTPLTVPSQDQEQDFPSLAIAKANEKLDEQFPELPTALKKPLPAPTDDEKFFLPE